MLKINKKRIKENIEKIKSKYLMVLSFIIANLINGILLRGVTVGEPFRIQPLFIDFGLLILISLLSLFFKRKNRPKYFFIISIVLTLVCLINSIYYHYYSSFASISLLSNLVYAKDVGNAIFENVLEDYMFELPGSGITTFTITEEDVKDRLSKRYKNIEIDE